MSSITVSTETWLVLKFPGDEAPDVVALFTKLHKYRAGAGYKSGDKLELTKRDKEIIKDVYQQFEHPEDQQQVQG